MENDDGVKNCYGEEKLFILFVLHEECFCFEGRFVKVDVVDLTGPYKHERTLPVLR